MRSIIAKRKYLLLAVILVLMQFTPIMQHAEARFTATVYMVIKYSDKHWEYKRMVFETHFGEYMITYQDENGKDFSISVWSKQLPFVVTYDPWDQPMKEEVE
ncbi:hypothetical protein EV586_10891 [Tumebacillus sp. BK434]|uniref:hypothetical protein n=1 Tax=Tumebacillus sp. BK434 TaxID=2512169 RepID=UPI0010474E09|nr:hypothetical protein [Tumebacillus sp. BK434]TCP52716.1 hypothetical protein EV586_10891 [Tumebacillus sp. BK434]